MNASALKKIEPVTEPHASEVRDAVIGFLDTGSDALQATNQLVAACEADTALYQRVVNGRLQTICAEVVSRVIRERRADIWTAPAPAAPTAAPIAALGAAVAESLMNFPLIGGKLLGDARRADVLACSNAYEIKASDMIVKARWLKAIASAMPDANKTVRASLSESRLGELKKQAVQVRESV